MSTLTIQEKSPFTHVIKLDYIQLDSIVNGIDPFTGETLGTAGQYPIANKPAFSAVSLAGVAETVALVGAADIVFDVGTTAGDPDEYIDALDVDAMTAPEFNTGDPFTDTVTPGVVNVADASNTAADIILEVNGTTGSLTAGEVVIGLCIVDLGKFA